MRYVPEREDLWQGCRGFSTLGDIGTEDASSFGSEQNAGVGGRSDTNQGGVVVGVQDAVEGAGLVEVDVWVMWLVF